MYDMDQETVAGLVAAGEISVPQLRTALKGQVIGPDDAGYDEARRVFFSGYDRRPAVIVQPTDESEVSFVVSLARETGMELAVRSGGHSLAGYSATDGGILLDLSAMRALRIDPERRTAWAQTGLTAGEYTTAVGAYSLATGFGDTGSVGIGGLTLGGGVGFLVRKYGLTIDSLLAADVVTADGRLLRADAEINPDLLWAIRGGGGNFGVVTQFQFRLHPVDTIVGGLLVLPATPDVIRSFVAEAMAAPDELSSIANVIAAPPLPFLPAEYHHQPVIMAIVVYAGASEPGQRAIAPFRSLATPLADMIRPMRYPEIYKLTEGGPHPVAQAIHTMFVDDVDERAGEAIVGHIRNSTAPLAGVQIRVLGGAVARVPVEDTAFAHRRRRILVNVAAAYQRPEEAPVHEASVAGVAAALRRQSPPGAAGMGGDAGVYVNFLGDDGQARIHEAYPGATWDRLTAIKARYDPTNLFHLNGNIPPAVDGSLS
jgi:FAD/FMN-containing dehydrogenase